MNEDVWCCRKRVLRWQSKYVNIVGFFWRENENVFFSALKIYKQDEGRLPLPWLYLILAFLSESFNMIEMRHDCSKSHWLANRVKFLQMCTCHQQFPLDKSHQSIDTLPKYVKYSTFAAQNCITILLFQGFFFTVFLFPDVAQLGVKLDEIIMIRCGGWVLCLFYNFCPQEQKKKKKKKRLILALTLHCWHEAHGTTCMYRMCKC